MRTIPFGRPIIGKAEMESVMEVLKGPILVHGPRAVEFEKSFAAFTGAPHAVSTSSCTAALHLSYFYLGIGKGDEVIVPAQTHVATAHAVELCSAKPVFVDAESATGNIDIEQVEQSITSATRAISVVHYLGMPVDMERINGIAKKHRLFVVEDCALAIGTRYGDVHAGLHGDVGCFSFYPVKHMTTAEGGMLVTRRKEIAEKLVRQKAFGVDRHMAERKIPGVYDVTMLGFNYRMSEIQAAIGIEQLKRIEGFLAKREENYRILNERLRGIDEITQFKSSDGPFMSSHYCLSVILKDFLAPKRHEIVAKLTERGVGTSVYYPRPVPHMSYYRDKYGYSEYTFPVASRISYQSIALPVGPHLNAEDMVYIADAIKSVIREVA
ncbi:MAG: DegT/DnrJ/EryC1/StrS family aminotransferase [Thermodesulfobacteriota bacterium]